MPHLLFPSVFSIFLAGSAISLSAEAPRPVEITVRPEYIFFFFISLTLKLSAHWIDRMWRDMWPSMVTHTRNLCSAFIPSKVRTHTHTHTQQWTHTHREHTPGAVGRHLCCGARGAVGGSVPCSRAPQSWYWGWRERCIFTPPTYNPCRTWDSKPQPLGYESNSLTIRPRLPWYILNI